MAKVLISLVSEQTIPNVRFIKDHTGEVDKYVFITTQEMLEEQKTQAMVDALNIPQNKYTRILVNNFNFEKIEHSLKHGNFNKDDEYLVNITGGTKPMSIVTMSFFSDYPKAKIFYVPIGEQTYRQVYPKTENPVKQFRKKLTLNEYFKAHNLKLISQEKKFSRKIQHAKRMLNKFIQFNGDIDKIAEFKNPQEMTNPEDRAYYSGGWFEEYVYWKFKEKFNLDDSQIAYSVKLRIGESENEYDAVFVHQGGIYIVECKAYHNTKGVAEKVRNAILKLAALDDYFGINSHSIIITTANLKGINKRENENLLERAKTLKVQLFQMEDLVDDKFLEMIK